MGKQITLFLPNEAPQNYDLDLLWQKKGSKSREPVLYLGRGPYHGADATVPRNDIVIPSEERFKFVSRAQCTFFVSNGRWHIANDSETNGLIFHNQYIKNIEMLDGDRFFVGKSETGRMCILFSEKEDLEQGTDVDFYELKGRGSVSIGRGRNCDIVIPHPTVSRLHCYIVNENGSYYLVDNDSTNGVLLNGNLVERKELLDSMAQITIADTVLVFDNGRLYRNRPQSGFQLSAEHLVKKVGLGNKVKTITNDVTLTIQPNEFVAIIGGSGAGKTTLLDCLSGMSGFTSGQVLINGENLRTAGKSLRSLMGYVPQKDIVYDSLTLEHMLRYSAQLRMPKDTSKAEIQEKINETLSMVELSEHRKTKISKLSGGQRKRASMAVELLASPKLFFLDEPSSGLDPGTERHLMQMLKKLSQTGKTVVMVTHTVQNIDLCDRIICMGKGGYLCFSGSPNEAKQFFQKEHFTDIYDDLNDHSQEVAERFKNREAVHSEKVQAPVEYAPKKDKRKMTRQFPVMTARYAEIMFSGLPRLALLLLMPVVLTLLVCIAFQSDGGIYAALNLPILKDVFPFLSAPDTLSLISAFSCAVFWVGIFNSIQEISKERNIYERERFAGAKVVPYIFSKFTILTVLCVAQSAIMTELLWVMSNTVARTNGKVASKTDVYYSISTEGVVFSGSAFWLELFLTTLLCMLSALCLGLLISSVVSNDLALVVCPVALLAQILFSGVATKLSGFTKTISNYISCRWACIGYLTSVNVNGMYQGYGFGTNRYQPTNDGEIYANAEYSVYKKYLFGQNPVISAWIALGLICLVCIVAAIVVLKLKRRESR